MNLDDITPLLLTFNEEANIRDTLTELNWAKQIIIVDSFSDDKTLAIASQFPQVVVVQRKFDNFAEQCNFGLTHVSTEWVLSLDADYKLTEAYIKELGELDAVKAGYQASFVYCIYGKPLRGTLYPPRKILYRREKAEYFQDGHAHHVEIDGDIGSMKSSIRHDDCKTLMRWVHSQVGYANREADKISGTPLAELGWKDKLRKRIVVAPFLTFFYCIIWKRLIFDGWPGMFYTLQRVFAELLLSMVLIDRKLRPPESNQQTN